MPKTSVHLGELIGARDAQVGVGLQNARGGDLHVVVVGQRFLDEGLQSFILEDGPPFHLRRIGRRRALRGESGALRYWSGTFSAGRL